jgi:hypothetical protein
VDEETIARAGCRATKKTFIEGKIKGEIEVKGMR